MKFLKVLEENLPATVEEDSIIFTERGNIYVNKEDGTLLAAGGTGESGGGGGSIDNDTLVAISNRLTAIEEILKGETSAFYRPKLVAVQGEDITYTNDFLSASPNEGTYAPSIGDSTITYVVKVPAGALSVTVVKQSATARFIISSFSTKPSGSMVQNKHVRNDTALELTLANLDSTDVYVAVYITNNYEDVPMAINFTVRKMLPV